MFQVEPLEVVPNTFVCPKIMLFLSSGESSNVELDKLYIAESPYVVSESRLTPKSREAFKTKGNDSRNLEVSLVKFVVAFEINPDIKLFLR